MATCIYCRRLDPPCGFNKEHIIPEALGSFRNALTLADSEVCRACNQHFGDTIDRLLTRDSGEAALRFRHRLKDAAEVRGMFKERVRARLPDDGSPLGGIYFDMVPPPEGELEPNVEMVPQVGFQRADGKGWDYFTEEQIRDQSGIAERIRRDYSRLRLVWYESEPMKDRILKLLTDKGIRFKGTTEFEPLLPVKPSGRVTVELEILFDVPLARAIAKIAFDYLAKMQGAAFALRGEFDAVRRFIREGEGKRLEFVHTLDAPIVKDKRGGPPPAWHFITLYWDGRREAILVQVALFNQFAYHVRLCLDFRGVWREVLSGHVFDVKMLEVRELPKTRIALPGIAF